MPYGGVTIEGCLRAATSVNRPIEKNGMALGERMIFVGGAPRSGTTMLQNMLDSHPKIYGGPEFDLIPTIIELRQRLFVSLEKGRITAFCDVVDVDDAIRALINRLLMPAADRAGCEFLSEKTPWNILRFRELMEVFPEAAFIHVVRDPRAVISSMLEVGARGTLEDKRVPLFARSLSRAIRVVEACYKASEAAENAFPGRMISVMYEQLVVSPEGELRKLCGALGIDWSPEMLMSGEKAHPGGSVIEQDRVWYTTQKYQRGPQTKEVDKWKDKLSAAQIAYINLELGKNLQIARYKYPLGIRADAGKIARIFAHARSWSSRVLWLFARAVSAASRRLTILFPQAGEFVSKPKLLPPQRRT